MTLVPERKFVTFATAHSESMTPLHIHTLKHGCINRSLPQGLQVIVCVISFFSSIQEPDLKIRTGSQDSRTTGERRPLSRPTPRERHQRSLPGLAERPSRQALGPVPAGSAGRRTRSRIRIPNPRRKGTISGRMTQPQFGYALSSRKAQCGGVARYSPQNHSVAPLLRSSQSFGTSTLKHATGTWLHAAPCVQLHLVRCQTCSSTQCGERSPRSLAHLAPGA